MNETLKRRADEIRTWNEALSGPVELRLATAEADELAPFESFLSELASLAPRVRVSGERCDGDGLPAICIGSSWTYHLVPEGSELSPFLDLLSRVATGESGLSDALSSKLRQVDATAEMEIFVTTSCPNCPAVLTRLAPFPLANPRIHVRVVDGLRFPDRSGELRIRAVPTVLLPGGIRFTGQVRDDEVAEGLLRGDPAGMGIEALSRMVQAGDAEGLAGMMLRTKRIFPGVLEILSEELFSLRLGAMVAMETVGAEDPELARTALDALWKRMDSAHPSARGDIVYLIGELGDDGWIPRLRGLLVEDIPDELREAVEDALESLGG